MPIEGGEETQLTFLAGDSVSPSWSLDGKRIVFVSHHETSHQVWTMNADGGDLRAIPGTEAAGAGRVIWMPESKILYQQVANRNFHFLDPDTLKERPLLTNEMVGWVFDPRLSTDRKQLAVNWNRVDDPQYRRLEARIWILSLEDAGQRFLPRTAEFSRLIGWSSDGKWLYAHASGGSTIHAVSVDREESRTLLTLPGSILRCSFHGAHRKIVCAVAETKSDVWMVENFDPDLSAPEIG